MGAGAIASVRSGELQSLCPRGGALLLLVNDPHFLASMPNLSIYVDLVAFFSHTVFILYEPFSLLTIWSFSLREGHDVLHRISTP